MLIPIYPPHYHYIYDLINKLKDKDIHIDIHLVFSNSQDYNHFTHKDKIYPIILESFETNSIITYKKFVGLKQLAHSTYDYIICCDSEIDIISENFTEEIINNKIEQIFYNKKLYAGNITGNYFTCIPEKCAQMFPGKYEYLKNITYNFTLYFWWSDLPVYRRVDLIPFFNMINYDNIVWEHFDYIIYQYYLILHDGFEIIDTTPITKISWCLEKLYTDNIDILNALINMKYGFSWNTKNFYNLNKEFIKAQKGFIIYHLDRDH